MTINVQFTDQSVAGPSGPIEDWAWDFGDTGTSMLESPSHPFAPDTYTVTLEVTSPDGTATVSKSVTVTAPALTAAFGISSTSGAAPLTVDFSDLSKPGPSGPITGHSWTFGDGGPSILQNPSHPYTAPGTYTAAETVTGTAPDGTATHSVTITVSSTPTPPTPPAGGTPGIGILDYGHLASYGSAHTNLYKMVIGSAWTSGDVTVMKTCPGRGLAYFAAPDVAINYSTGVPYAQALANNWLLKDASGNLLKNKSFNDYIGDIGSTGYRNAWITNVLTYLTDRPGIDGVFIDDVVYDPQTLIGSYPPFYPTTAAWAAAMVGWCKAIYAALNAHGYYVCLNAGAYKPHDSTFNDGTSTLNWWSQVAPYADGLMNEFYDERSDTQVRRPEGTAWYQYWASWNRVVAKAQSLGCDCVGLMKGSVTDTVQMMYGKATFLMEWDGGGSVFIYSGQRDSADTTNTAWTRDIGTPSAAKVAVGVGYKRVYTAGIAVINPSPSTPQTFSLGGSYHNPSGTVVSSVTLAPTTAMILYS